jgi:hypothetical protein
MSKVEKLYQDYCTEQTYAMIAPEYLCCMEKLSKMLPKKDYMEIEELISDYFEQNDKELFLAGFNSAMQLIKKVAA